MLKVKSATHYPKFETAAKVYLP